MPVASKSNLEVGCLRNKHPPLEAERSDYVRSPVRALDVSRNSTQVFKPHEAAEKLSKSVRWPISLQG